MGAKKDDGQRKKTIPPDFDPDLGMTRAEIEALDAEMRKHPELLPTREDLEQLGRWMTNTKERL